MLGSKLLHKLQDNFFNAFIIISYSLIIISALGFSKIAPQYLETLDYYVKIYVCLFLIIRFNPFVHVSFTELDRKIAFSAGLFILTTSALNSYIQDFTDKLKNIANNASSNISTI